MQKRVILGLSGGMDSAYVALKLLEAGYEVIAVNIIMCDSCDCSAQSRALAEQLGIEFIIINARAEFEKLVKRPFAEAYVNGETPNPCVVCNPLVKFGKLFSVMKELGADYVATGHYAVPVFVDGRWSFSAAADTKKDQGYFLYGLSQDMLPCLLMPLGTVLKEDIKRFFADNRTVLPPKTESTDICFVSDGSYTDIISEYSQLPPVGNFIDADGNILGKHKGIHNYTVGQRKGLGIALGAPAYVSAINASDNTVTLSVGRTVIDGFTVTYCNYMAVPKVYIGQRFKVRVRYRAIPVDCVVADICDDEIAVKFIEPQPVVARGQSAVFYTDDGCIAFGGVIS